MFTRACNVLGLGCRLIWSFSFGLGIVGLEMLCDANQAQTCHVMLSVGVLCEV